jgi:protein-S-isoprenylcysteine O-methyltransferase Ste14
MKSQKSQLTISIRLDRAILQREASMPLTGLVLVLVLGLFLSQIFLLIPLDVISSLNVPLWLIGAGILILFSWLLGD